MFFVASAAVSGAHGAGLPFPTVEIGKYLLVGMGPVNTVNLQPGVADAADTSNFELGANKAPTPSISGFANGSSGPTIRGAAPNIPLNAKVVGTGIFGDGNIAITNDTGQFKLQNTGLYADLGVRCAQVASGCDSGTSNSFFNDPNQFPNTFIQSGTGNPINNNIDGTGTFVGPGDALQSTRMDNPSDPSDVGITGNFDFTSLLAEINTAKNTVAGLAATASIDFTGGGNKLTKEIDTFLVTNFTPGNLNDDITVTDTQIMDGRGGTSLDNPSQVGNTKITLGSGLNVIDLITNGDFNLNESSLVINGAADSFAIFRVADVADFLVSNGNILVGNGGIGLNNVIFYSDAPGSTNSPDNSKGDFSLQNSVVNGVAFWTVGAPGSLGAGEINFSNVQGCTQLVADKIHLSDVRLNRCGPGGMVPEPASVALFALGALGMGLVRLRRRTSHRGV